MTDRQSIACIVSPNATDAGLAVGFLYERGIEAHAFPSLRHLAAELDERAGCLILIEECLVAEDIPYLREALGRLPEWADVPLILVSHDSEAFGILADNAFPRSGNVTLLERPLNPHSLISAVQVALRATGHQRQLAELIDQRENAIKLRDEFLAMLAHELRNPLAPMRNSLYIMRTLNVQEPAVLKTVGIMERQVNHVVRMVDDLMDVARLERGKVELKKQRVDLNRLVASAVETCLPLAQEKGHQVSVRFGTDALVSDADEVRIEQIVCNLVHNAAKFSREPDVILVETGAEDGFARISVEDHGIGFHASAADRLFDPFLQANPTLERSSGGLGLGLTIVRRLAELHGGTVRATSRGPGQGSRFEVRIPLAQGAAGAQAPEAGRAPVAGCSRRIVVIEDNPDIQETLRILLTMWGHEVYLAGDGPSGVERVLEIQPDFALVDVGLPRMNGYEVARAIRNSHGGRNVRLIAVTGYGQPADREKALHAGFETHLLKPIAPEVLEKLLAEQGPGAR